MGEWSDWGDSYGDPSGPPASPMEDSDYPSESLGFDDPNASYDMPYNDDEAFDWTPEELAARGIDVDDAPDEGGIDWAGAGRTVLQHIAGRTLPSLRHRTSVGGGLYESEDYYPPGETPDNLGVYPMPPPPRRGGGAGMSQALVQYRGILETASQAIGKRISGEALVRFMVKWGWQAAAAATRLTAAQLQFVFMRVKSVPHRHRGPHLGTVVKRIRTGDRYRKMLGKYARKVHAGSSSGGGHSHKKRYRALKGRK